MNDRAPSTCGRLFLRVAVALFVFSVLIIAPGCVRQPVAVDDSRTDFKNEFDIFKDLCAAAMEAGRRTGSLDAGVGRGYRAAEFSEIWSRRNAVDMTPLSTANKRSVIDCGIRGYDIGYGHE